MPRLKAQLLALALSASLALGLAACGGGGSDLLPGTTASEINSNLEEVKVLVSETNCSGAEEAVAEVRAEIEGLQGVDARLVEALGEGADRLEAVVSGCEEPEAEEEPETFEETEETEEPEERETEKPEKQKPEGEEPPEKETGPPPSHQQPPGQEKKEEKAAPPAEEAQPPSGGVGPSSPVGGGE
ncbi:MAG: hypothetical protein U0R71_07860 [Solirubrobacterales bacterium]